MPVKMGLCAAFPAAIARLARVLGPLAPGAEFVPLPGEDGGGTTAWLGPLLADRVDLVLCPVDAAREIPRDDVDVLGVTRRSDPRDVLLGPVGGGASLALLPPGALVAAPCVRTAGFVRARRPDLQVVRATGLASDLIRVDRGELVAVVTSRARIHGTPEDERTSERFGVVEWVPAPGSGVLVILARAGESGAPLRFARAVADRGTMAAVRAEVTTARGLDPSPGRGVGVAAFPMPGGLRVLAMVVSADGTQVVRGRVVARNGTPPSEAATRLVRILGQRGAESVGLGGEWWAVSGREGCP